MNLTWSRIPLTLRRPFRTATALRTTKQTLWLRLQHDNQEGWGEAVPVDTYGQTLETAEAVLPGMARYLESERGTLSLTRIEALVDELLQRYPTERATLAAVDAALHDVLGKALSTPVWKVLGLD